MQTRKHAWNDGAAATAQGADANAGGSARLLRSTQSTTFSTSNHTVTTSLCPCQWLFAKNEVSMQNNLAKSHSSRLHCRDRTPSKHYLNTRSSALVLSQSTRTVTRSWTIGHCPLRLLASVARGQHLKLGAHFFYFRELYIYILHNFTHIYARTQKHTHAYSTIHARDSHLDTD